MSQSDVKREHGQWIKQNPMVDTEECSVCGYNIVSEEMETPFCPWCGADMRDASGGEGTDMQRIFVSNIYYTTEDLLRYKEELMSAGFTKDQVRALYLCVMNPMYNYDDDIKGENEKKQSR